MTSADFSLPVLSWYPGHMHAARRELGKRVRECQALVEILDARAPAATANPLLQQLAVGLPRIRVLNKADLADPEVTELWLRYFEQAVQEAAPQKKTAAPSGKRQGVPQSRCLVSSPERCLSRGTLAKLLQEMCPPSQVGERLQVLVTGIPNVGKSTFINQLRDKAVAATGDEPAVTRRLQRVPLDDFCVLIDTPGMLWPGLDKTQQHRAYLLAMLGSIRNTAMDLADVGWFAAELLLREHPAAVAERYDVANRGAAATKMATRAEAEAGTAAATKEGTSGPEALLHQVARRRGGLGKGGRPDLQRAGGILLNDFRSGRLGRLSLEGPPSP